MKKTQSIDFTDTPFWDNAIQTLMAHNMARNLPQIIDEFFETYVWLPQTERHFFLKLLATTDGKLNPIQIEKTKAFLKKSMDTIPNTRISPEERKKDLTYFNTWFNKRQKLENEMAECKLIKDYDRMDRERFGRILREARKMGISNQNLQNLAVSMGTLKVFPVRPKGKGDKRLNSAIQWPYPRIFKATKEK